jgi:peptidoglycan/LPS O-acetylase OafA/YrhL
MSKRGDWKLMLYSINFLRFVAALGVVVFHASYSRFNVGQAGVDVFFVISGIVISYATPADESARAFFAKRLTRILPLYWIATIAYVGFRWAAWGLLPNTHTLVTSMLLLPDFSAQHWMPLYFPAWTLIFEFFFYGVFGLLLAFRQPRIVIIIMMAAIAAVPAAPGSIFAGTFSPTMCVEFVFGLIICERLKARLVVPRYVGAFCLCIAAIILAANFHLHSGRVLEWGIPAALLIVGSLGFEGTHWMQSRAAVLAGNASYSIYLFHETVIECLANLGSQFHLAPYKHRSLLEIFFLASISVAVGILIHLMIEKPLLIWLRSVIRRRWQSVSADQQGAVLGARSPEKSATFEYDAITRNARR